ncbi:glutamate racemase [Colwelliaceae bacterium 6471]
MSNSTLNIAKHPIGVFDSGVGGLSITKCIQQQLPNEQIIYVADSRYAPYGDKSPEFIIERVNKIAHYLIAQGVKAIVVACNTATVNAIDQLRQQVSIPIIGVEPAIKPAVNQSKTNKVAILVTTATATNERFLALVNRFSSNAQVTIVPCPGLVELIEQGKIDSPECDKLLARYLTPLLNSNVDTIVLGCTHYPFLLEKINDIVHGNISIMETAEPVTQELIRQLDKRQLLSISSTHKPHRFISSLANKDLEKVFVNLWQQSLSLELMNE